MECTGESSNPWPWGSAWRLHDRSARGSLAAPVEALDCVPDEMRLGYGGKRSRKSTGQLES